MKFKVGDKIVPKNSGWACGTAEDVGADYAVITETGNYYNYDLYKNYQKVDFCFECQNDTNSKLMANYKERLDEIIFHLTDQSGWDLIGTTQEQHNELTAQLIVDRQETKQAITSLIKELVEEAKPEVPEEYERDDALSIGFTRGTEYYHDAISNLFYED